MKRLCLPIPMYECSAVSTVGFILLLISTAFVEIIRKMSNSNTPSMCSNNTMPRNNPDNNIEPSSLEFGAESPIHSFCAVQSLFEVTHLQFPGSTIALSIISLQVFIGIPNEGNSSDSLMVVPILSNSSALQLPGISLCPHTQVIQISYRFATSFRHLGQSYTVLVLIALESNALIVNIIFTVA